RIKLAAQAIQTVVNIVDGVAYAIGFAGQISDGVVAVGFHVRGRKIRLRHAAEGIVGEIRLVVICIRDADQIAFRVVGVGRDVAGRIGYGQEAVRVVVGVARDFAVLVRYGRSAATIVIRESRRRAVRIRD